MRILMLSTALLVALTGCVAKGKYDESLSAYAEVSRERDALVAERDRLIAERARADQDHLDAVAALEAQIAAAQQDLDETRSRLVAAMADSGTLQSEVASMREALEELEQRKAQSERALADYRDLVGRFQSLIDAGTLRVKFVDGRMLVELATDILFPPARAEVSEPGQAALTEVAGILASIRDRQYQVAGHTDNVPIRTDRFPSNWELGSARATAVLNILTANGLDAARVSAASYAETKPVAPNDTTENKAMNRRIEIVVVPDLSTLPGYAELEAMSGQ